MQIVNCLECNKLFKVYPSRLKRGNVKFCSTKCHGISLKGISFAPENEFKKGFKQGKNQDNPNWKGDKATIRGIHGWILRHWSKANECEKCGTNIAKRYDWANKTGNYTRKREDWIKLCRSCHVSFDKNWIKKKTTIYGDTYKNKPKIKICIKCGKKYWNKNSDSNYCSKLCWYQRNKII